MITYITLKNLENICNNNNNIDIDTLYKKCGFKNSDNFLKINTFIYNNNEIELWGKNKGTNNNLNNHSLLCKMNVQLYGKAILLLKHNNEYISFSIEEFNKFSTNFITNNEDISANDTDTSDSELSMDVYCYSSDE